MVNTEYTGYRLYVSLMPFSGCEVQKPGDCDSTRNWGRRDAKDAAFCNLDRRPTAVWSDDDAPGARPGEHARLVVLVMLPFDEMLLFFRLAFQDGLFIPLPRRCNYDSEPFCNNFSSTLKRESTSSGLQSQGPRLRSCPHCGQSPAQSSRQIGIIGRETRMFCRIASVRSSR